MRAAIWIRMALLAGLVGTFPDPVHLKAEPPAPPASRDAPALPLKPAAPPVGQILVRFQVVDIDRSQLRKSGLEISPSEVLDPNSALPALLTTLVQQKIARIVAEPSVCTCNQSAAAFHSGGQIPIRFVHDDKEIVEYKKLGTEIGVLPSLQDDGRLRIQFQLRLTSVDESATARLAKAGESIPALRMFSVESSFVAAPGQTFVANGLVYSPSVKRPADAVPDQSNADESNVGESPDGILRIVLITPTIIESPSKASALVPAHAANPRR